MHVCACPYKYLVKIFSVTRHPSQRDTMHERMVTTTGQFDRVENQNALLAKDTINLHIESESCDVEITKYIYSKAQT